MSTTKRSDLIYVDILQAAIRGAFAGRQALNGTGAAVMSSTLPGFNVDGSPFVGGDTIRVPYFDSVGELEDVAEGDGLVPRKLASTSETSTVVQSGIATQITSWAQLTAQFADPYAEFARQFAESSMRRIDKGLIDAALATDLVHDISGESGAAGAISYDALVDAQSKWGDEQDDGPAMIIMHSAMAQYARKLKDETGSNRPLFVDQKGDNGLREMAGMPVRLSDRLVATAGVYPVLLVRRGALAAWYNGEPTVETGRDILSASDIAALHLLHVEHLYKRPRGGTGTKRGVVKLLCKASAS